MSLRWKLALAMALVAGLVSSGFALFFYTRERANRLESARASVAQDLRRDVPDALRPDYVPPARVVIEVGTAVEQDAPAPPGQLRRIISSRPGQIVSVFYAPTGEVQQVWAGVQLLATPSLPARRVFRFESYTNQGIELDTLRTELIVQSLVASAVGAIVGLLLSLVITRPLRRSVRVARRVAAGDLDARLAPRGRDEIAELGRALDEMTSALSTKISELDDAAERERRFSSDVAHELRTPVTGLVAASSLLEPSAPAAMVQERAATIRQLIEDLLEVMRLEGSREELRIEEFDVMRLIADVIGQRAPAAHVLGGASLIVRTDSRRLERVLANLVDNAARHGRPPIEVSVAPNGTIEVRDHGPGFGKFMAEAGERFAMARPERGSGTGLGLAIAAGQARLLGASLDLRDDGGAVVTLRLPAAAVVGVGQDVELLR